MVGYFWVEFYTNNQSISTLVTPKMNGRKPTSMIKKS